MPPKRNFSQISRDSSITTNGDVKMFSQSMGDEMVDLIVGEEKKLFRVHKQKICRIPYFDKMFNGHFKEAGENKAMFPEDSVESFDILLTWLYQDALPPYEVEVNKETGSGSPTTWHAEDVYALAEKLCIFKLMDLIIDTIRQLDLKKLCTTPFAIDKVYKQTPTGSLLRKYYMQALCYNIQKRKVPVIDELVDELVDCLGNKEFARDFVRLVQHPVRVNPKKAPACEFHSHGKGEACSLARKSG